MPTFLHEIDNTSINRLQTSYTRRVHIIVRLFAIVYSRITTFPNKKKSLILLRKCVKRPIDFHLRYRFLFVVNVLYYNAALLGCQLATGAGY